MPLTWGIVGASKIAHDFCVALASGITAEQHRVIAIASRQKSRAQIFAGTHSIPRAYGSYEELGKDADVEIVYVTVINAQHFAVCSQMIKLGKHVLCEKPLGLSYRQAKVLIGLANSQRVFLMEGLWSRCLPSYEYLTRALEVHAPHEIREVYVKHGIKCSTMERIVKKELGGGIVLDIGCFAIQFVLLVFREAPKDIKASGKINADDVDLHFEAELTFSAGRTAHIVCSGLEPLDNQATIITKRGPICLPMYWCPTHILESSGAVNSWPLGDTPSSSTTQNYQNTLGLKYEADEVKRCLRNGKLHSLLLKPEDTLLIAQIQDEIRQQIGARYQ